MRRRQIQAARREAEAAQAVSVISKPKTPKQLRELRGLTRSEVAALTGVSEGTVRTIESLERSRQAMMDALS